MIVPAPPANCITGILMVVVFRFVKIPVTTSIGILIIKSLIISVPLTTSRGPVAKTPVKSPQVAQQTKKKNKTTNAPPPGMITVPPSMVTLPVTTTGPSITTVPLVTVTDPSIVVFAPMMTVTLVPGLSMIMEPLMVESGGIITVVTLLSPVMLMVPV